MAKTTVPLISEDYPEGYDSYQFISLIQYGREKYLTVIDNSNDETIRCYVLDLCGPEEVDEHAFLEIASIWYKTVSDKFPLSVALTRLGLNQPTSRILRTFDIEFVSRVIGPIPRYGSGGKVSVKRKKKRTLPNEELREFSQQLIAD